MDYNEFREKLIAWLPENIDDYSIGNDLNVNTRITVDENGIIYLRKYSSFTRVKTSVNINDIVEFRRTDYDEKSFFIITKDNNGFKFESDDELLYFCEDGEPSGWGTAIEHFTRFPVGTATKHYRLVDGEIVLV